MNNRLKFTKASRQNKALSAFLPRIVEKRPVGKRSFDSAVAMAAAEGQYLNADSSEDKEVKMNLRFCDNSFHDPLIHFDFKQFTPDVEETKSKALACQQQCSGDLLSRLWSSEHLQKNTRTVTSHSMDSIMTAVFTAFDYDIDYASNACNVKE